MNLAIHWNIIFGASLVSIFDTTFKIDHQQTTCKIFC